MNEHMHHGDGAAGLADGHGWLSDAIMLIALALVAASAAYFFMRYRAGRLASRPDTAQLSAPAAELTGPVDILDMRYARGEIDSQDWYERRTSLLSQRI